MNYEEPDATALIGIAFARRMRGTSGAGAHCDSYYCSDAPSDHRAHAH
jgi:hypothetical protein